MNSFVLISMILTSSAVSVGQSVPPKTPAVQQAQPEQPKPPVVTPKVEARRKDFRGRCEVIAMQISKDGKKASVQHILFGTLKFNDEFDGALVVFKVDNKYLGMFFVFQQDRWSVIPEDFLN